MWGQARVLMKNPGVFYVDGKDLAEKGRLVIPEGKGVTERVTGTAQDREWPQPGDTVPSEKPGRAPKR